MKNKKQCKLLLRDSILNITGISDQNIIQIKGDSGLRESVFSREKKITFVDNNLEDIQEKILFLLLSSGVFNLILNFGSSTITTRTFYEPFAVTIHKCDQIINDNYMKQQFPIVSYKDKIAGIREIKKFLSTDNMLEYIRDPSWRSLQKSNTNNWKPMEITDIVNVIGTLQKLRDIEHFYIRKININISQNIILLVFNCGGTTVLAPDKIDSFVEENL